MVSLYRCRCLANSVSERPRCWSGDGGLVLWSPSSWLARRFPCYYVRQSSTTSAWERGFPLRILFCGSDEFSSASLYALHQESLRDSCSIASIDVLCRPGKPYGRGLKLIRDPKIKGVAQKLGLPVHQIDSFQGWKLPEYPGSFNSKINLVIAVSFGLLIPSSILNATRYGGVNLHPSMLPKYKGPAPLRWTILDGESKTGVTLQTLHPTSFDSGAVLDQTPSPGTEIPEDCNHAQLLQLITPLGADMLVKAIQNRLYLSPPKAAHVLDRQERDETSHKYARKVKKEDSLLDFAAMDSAYLMRISRTFDSSWAFALVRQSSTRTSKKRLIFEEQFTIHNSAHPSARAPEVSPGIPYWSDTRKQIYPHDDNYPLLINTIDGSTISIKSLKVEGDVKLPAQKAALKHRLAHPLPEDKAEGLVTFHEALTTHREIV